MPITKWRYNATGDRSEVVEEINQCRRHGGIAVDFGGGKKTLDGMEGIDLVVDHEEPEWACEKWHCLDLNIFDAADVTYIDDYCDVHNKGKFDWSICTHTLEDLHYPESFLWRLPHCAEAGYIAVPSIYFELMQVHGTLGFIHHRTLWTVEDGVLVGHWKIPFLLADEIKDEVDRKARIGYERGDRELEVWWEGDLPFRIEPLGPSMEAVKKKYHNLIARI